MPLSIVGTFGVMYLLGYSLNNLSLMALTISTGFVVDDAIVMIENIDRYLEMGDSPLDAALKGSEQIGFTILSLTVSLIAVLIPLLFMGDIVGRLFREFAVTLAVTILVSAFVSLTLTPMMSAKLLKHKPESEQNAFYHKSERVVRVRHRQYGVGVRWVLRHQTFTLLVTLGTLVLTLVLYSIVPKGFFPVQDTGVFWHHRGAQSISFCLHGATASSSSRSVILEDPDVVSALSSSASTAPTPRSTAAASRSTSSTATTARTPRSEIIQRLQPQAQPGRRHPVLPAAAAGPHRRRPRQPHPVPVHRRRRRLRRARADGPTSMVAEFKKLPVLTDVASDQQISGLGATARHRPRHRLRLGITPQNIDDTLDDAFGQRQVSTIFTQLNQYHVVLEVAPQFQRTPDSLDNIYVKSSQRHPGPALHLHHFDHAAHLALHQPSGPVPAVTISFNLAHRAIASATPSTPSIRPSRTCIRPPA